MGTGSARGFVNQVTGTATGAVIQAGTVHGGVHVHQTIASAPVPRQLPPVPAHFTNRHAELDHLSRLIQQGDQPRVSIAVLTGSGGVGKTALALRWLRNRAEWFPGGQLYVMLGAFNPAGPITTTTALGQFLRALGVAPAQIPYGLAEQTALFRSVTADHPVSVLADDAASTAQVRSLLPASPGSVLLVTSRGRLGGLALEGAHIIVVDALNEAAGLDMLSRTIGQDRVDAQSENARTLVALCGGLPIALSIAAAQLSTKPRRPIAHLVENLSDEHRRLDSLALAGETSVYSSFDLSYRELSAGTARLYRLMGACPGVDFDRHAAAAVAAISAQTAEDILDDLVNASLVMDTGPDRYRFHDLVRLHAAQRSRADDTESDRFDAIRRLTEWYLDSAIAADLVVMPRRRRHSQRHQAIRSAPPAHQDASTALDWLEQELPNLLDVVKFAIDQKWWDLVWQFCEALWGLFLYRKHYEQWIDTHTAGIAAAHAIDDLVAAARLHVQLGTAYLNLARFDEASDEFSKALQLGRTTGDPQVEATAMEHLGLAKRGLGRPTEAMENFHKALAICERLHKSRGVALHTRRIGETLVKLGRYQDGLGYLRRSETTAAEIGDPVLRARALTRLVDAHLALHEISVAADCAHEAIDVLRTSGADHYYAEALQASAEVATTQGNLTMARDQLLAAQELYNRAGGPQAARVQAQLDALGAAVSSANDGTV